jgi:hypothetical protein
VGGRADLRRSPNNAGAAPVFRPTKSPDAQPASHAGGTFRLTRRPKPTLPKKLGFGRLAHRARRQARDPLSDDLDESYDLIMVRLVQVRSSLHSNYDLGDLF